MKEIIGNAQEADWHHLCRALILDLSVGSVSAAIRTVTIRVKGMTCGGIVNLTS